MDEEKGVKAFTKKRSAYHSTTTSTTTIITYTSIFLLLLTPLFFHLQASPFYFFTSSASASRDFLQKWKGIAVDTTANVPAVSKLRDSVTFLPLKDLRFAQTPMDDNTWFMSSFNDTHEENEAEYMLFPSRESKSRILCIKGRDMRDGTENSYALAWPEAIPHSATFLKGLTFVSDTYYDYTNLWHGLSAMAPFVSWSMTNECVKPERWVLFHWGELRLKMGSWIQKVMEANFGEVKVEGFEAGDGTYCFEKAVVMRHNEGSMGKDNKLQVFDLLRCQARKFCGIEPAGKGKEVNLKGEPVIRLTLLMRKGSRSFKNATAVTKVFEEECTKVEGCALKVAQSEDLTFCDQVRVMTNTDVVASPHGAQLTNMLFMDRGSSVMEFFPKGWLELAGPGQYAHHWMADHSGMNHRGAWWDPLGEKECPKPDNTLECFLFYKDGKVGHNETHLAEWSRTVLNQVRKSKLQTSTASFIPTLQANAACKC